MTSQIFGDVFVEDPLFMCEIAQSLVLQQEQELARKNQLEKARGICDIIGSVLNVSTNCFRYTYQSLAACVIYSHTGCYPGILYMHHVHVFILCVFQLVSFRHRLLDAAWETEILSKVILGCQ